MWYGKIKYNLVLVICVCFILSSCNRNSGIVIKRTDFGVPHIYASTIYGLFYGYGYVVGQDRLFQMEMAKHSIRGSVASVLGEDYVEFDIKTHTNMDVYAIEKQYEKLPKEDKIILTAYADGINAWIAETKNNPDENLPYEYGHFNFKPTLWNGFDVAMVFVGSMCYRYSDFSTELENLALLNALQIQYGKNKGASIFNQLIWKKSRAVSTTIDSSDVGNQKTVQHIDELFNKLENTASPQVNIEQYKNHNYPYASNIWLLNGHKLKDGKSMLYNGPQFGWFNPAYTYEIGLHGAGFNVVGSSPFAYPALIFGYNGHISWGSTAGFADMVDYYQETLNTKNKFSYMYNGKYVDMEKIVDTIRVKNKEDIYHTKYKTVHGLVTQVDTVNNVAYSKKRSWEGKELETFFSWLYVSKVRNHKQWLKQAEKFAISINWYYADKNGNIGYVFAGKLPDRKEHHDWRLPVSGDGQMEWNDLLSFDSNPKIYNPKSGYIANWNNAPSEDYNNSDMFWLAWSNVERINILKEVIDKKETFSKEEVLNIDKITSYKDIYIDYFIDDILNNGNKNEIYKSLKNWNRMNEDNNRDGYYDSPAITFFRLWLDEALRYTLSDDIPKPFFENIYSSTFYPLEKQPTRASHYVTPGVKLLYFAMNKEKAAVVQKFDFLNGSSKDKAISDINKIAERKLLKKFGRDIRKWKTKIAPNYYRADNFLNIPQTTKNNDISGGISLNRGTQNHWVFFGNTRQQAGSVVPPGQSGFVNLKGEAHSNSNDQLEMYRGFEYKPILLTIEEVNSRTISETVLNVE